MVHASILRRLALCSASLVAATAGQAALVNRGSDMVYDDVLNVTWVRNASLCRTLDNCLNRLDDSRTGVVSGMRWNDAHEWASTLVFRGYDDWRLPWASVSKKTGPVGDFGVVDCATASELECRDNEMGYMYAHNLQNLGEVALYNIQGEGWSGTAQGGVGGTSDGSVQWAFNFRSGRDDQAFGNVYGMMAWAVRDGDVSDSGPALPKPSTLALAGAALFVLASNRMRRPAVTTV